jgi:hypothetical protein
MNYDFTVRHRPGVTHQNADVLSRFPRADATDVTGARLDDDHLTAGAVLTSAEQGGDGVILHSPGIAAALALCCDSHHRTAEAVDFQLLQAVMQAEPCFSCDGPVTCADELLVGHLGLVSDARAPLSAEQPLVAAQQQALQSLARTWVWSAAVTDAVRSDMWDAAPHQNPVFIGEPDQLGVRPTSRVCTKVIPSVLIATAPLHIPRALHCMSPSVACVQGWRWCCATASSCAGTSTATLMQLHVLWHSTGWLHCRCVTHTNCTAVPLCARV